MPLKNLEHDGGERFDLNKRKKYKEAITKEERIKEETKDDVLEKLQQEYLHPNNEALWDEF